MSVTIIVMKVMKIYEMADLARQLIFPNILI